MRTYIYRIRREDELYSNGGIQPKFGLKGKVWKKRNHLTNHLTLLKEQGDISVYDDCYIEKFLVNETFTVGVRLDSDKELLDWFWDKEFPEDMIDIDTIVH